MVYQVTFAKNCKDKDGFIHAQAIGWCVVRNGVMVDNVSYHLQHDAQEHANQLNAEASHEKEKQT